MIDWKRRFLLRQSMKLAIHCSAYQGVRNVGFRKIWCALFCYIRFQIHLFALSATNCSSCTDYSYLHPNYARGNLG